MKSPLIIGAKLKGDGARGTRFSLVAIMLIVGSAVAVYNADSLYLAGDRGLSAQIPSTVAVGANNTILVLTTDASGEPAADRPYTIDVTVNGTSIASLAGATDSKGLAAPQLYVPPFAGKAVLVVRSGSQELSREVKAGAGSSFSRVFLTTDKPIYQPGQVVHARLLVLRKDLWATGAAPGALVTFEVKTPQGDRILRKTAELDAFGVVSFDYPLSDQLPLGNYQLKAMVGGFEVAREVKVDEYVLPRFDISFGELERWYTFDDTIDAYALVKYFFGETVHGTAKLQINVFDGSAWALATTVESRPLVNGTFEFSYDLSDLLPDYWSRNYGNRYWGDYRYYDYTPPDSLTVELNLTVTDTGDHTESDSQLVTIARGPILLTALADVNIEGQTSNYYLVARYPDGMPVPSALISWSILRKGDGGTRAMPAVTTDARGVATLTFEYDEDFESMRVTASKDDFEADAQFHFRASHGIKAVSDRPTYAVGEVAVFDIFHAGDPASDLLYYDVVADGFTVATGHVSMPGDRATLRLPVTADFGHLTSVRFYRIERNFVIARDVATIGVSKEGGDLDITITPDRGAYLPQDDVSLAIEVMRQGVGVPAMLGVSIVDNAVLELGARFTGFEEVLAGLGPFYTDPYYQLMGYILAGDVALPSQGYREWRREGVEPVESTGYELNAKAGAFKDDAVAAWWVVLGSAAVVGLIAILAMGQRTRHWKAILAVLTLAVAPTLAVWGTVSNLDAGQQDDVLGVDDSWNGIGPPPPSRAPAMEGDAAGGFGFDLPDIFNKGGSTSDDETFGTDGPGGGYAVPSKRGSVRQFFPETWAWVPALPTDDKGVATLDLVAPDSITSWDVSVIASTQDALVGVAHENVTVFQEFFVEPDLPAKAFLGDRFPLKVQVYNYGEPTSVEVRLAPTSWFRVEDTNHATLDLGRGEVASVEFTVTMLEVGVHEVRVTGESRSFVDTVVRPLRVKPAGEHVTDMFQGVLMSGDSQVHTFTLLPEMVPNSENAWVKLQGGIEAVVMEGAESYIHMVSGCGEQSMSGLSVDVLAFIVARQGGLAEDELLRLEAIVNQGIQYEMQFLYDDGDGRGIVYYPGQKEVNAWLTAWGLQTFAAAKAGGFAIDDDILLDMRHWLKAHQSTDGHFDFAEWRYYSYDDPSLEKRRLATTAYIVNAILLSGVDAGDPAVQRALDYIAQGIEGPTAWEDSYVLALGLRALVAGGRGGEAGAREVADRLHELRVEDGNHTYWGSSTNMICYERFEDDAGPRELLDKNPGYVVETTGYATQALYAMGSYLDDVRGALRFLVEGRSQYGGWYSTQDTVVAFQTVWQVSKTVADVDMDVEVLVEGELALAQSFDASNSDMTYLLDLRPLLGPTTTTVTVRGTGTGSVIFQAFLEQWVPWKGGGVAPLELTVDYGSGTVRVGEAIEATARLTNRQALPVKMALIELVAPVGMRLVASQFEGLLASGVVDYVEWADGAVRLYITDLGAGESVRFVYSLQASMPADVTLAGNRAFDMYNSLIATELEPVEISVYIP